MVKVGRVRIRFPGSPFPAGGGGFRATLDLASATLHVTGGSGFSARLWVDANSPVLRISAQGLGFMGNSFSAIAKGRQATHVVLKTVSRVPVID